MTTQYEQYQSERLNLKKQAKQRSTILSYLGVLLVVCIAGGVWLGSRTRKATTTPELNTTPNSTPKTAPQPIERTEHAKSDSEAVVPNSICISTGSLYVREECTKVRRMGLYLIILRILTNNVCSFICMQACAMSFGGAKRACSTGCENGGLAGIQLGCAGESHGSCWAHVEAACESTHCASYATQPIGLKAACKQACIAASSWPCTHAAKNFGASNGRAEL